EFKFSRIHIFEKPAPESQFDSRLVAEFRAQYRATSAPFLSIADVLSAYPDDPRAWARHPGVERIRRTLANGRSCLLIGSSSSGKTVLALQAGQLCAEEKYVVNYLNLGTTSGSVPYCLIALLRASLSGPRHIWILDDLQSNPLASHYIAQIANLSRRA